MIEKFTQFLTNRIRKEMPDIDDERAEVINYGLQNIVGEFPKMIIVILLAFLLGIGKLTLINLLILMPYRYFAGGFHAKTHIGCILSTAVMFCFAPFVSRFFILNEIAKYVVIGSIWIFGMIMIKLYAPADTENVPILRKKERMQKQIISFIVFTIEMLIALFINNPIITNMIIISLFLQTITITRLAYKITDNKYGYEVYGES